MAKVQNSKKILQKIFNPWVGCTNVAGICVFILFHFIH